MGWLCSLIQGWVKPWAPQVAVGGAGCRGSPAASRPFGGREEGRRQADDPATEAGPENTGQADAEWIFTGVHGDPKPTRRDTAGQNPLRKYLRAVGDGHAENVKDETWYLGPGVTAADGVPDDLRGFLAWHRPSGTDGPAPTVRHRPERTRCRVPSADRGAVRRHG
ncbi:hypothetical protein GCM10010211_16060 [Streptomyces albospinus]|uniref:Uncharacterized protein n=1 Tax=Streptomyces albospinus TaxID=285515 RepID=A0ABQ2UUK7_9ACTN|nr:hypothetical protein GCM10010211_16060 [Streptomyces albospinus]